MNYEIPKLKLWGILLACGVAFGQPSNVSVRASYPTQTVLCATVNPASTYTITVTAEGSTIPDFDQVKTVANHVIEVAGTLSDQGQAALFGPARGGGELVVAELDAG